MPMKSVRKYLDSQNVKYEVMQHAKAYTAHDVAESAHIPERFFAKTVMVKVDGRMALAVLPASDHIDIKQLARSLGADSVTIAEEDEFKDSFPDCEVGAMPPFGNLFNLEVFVSPHLVEADQIAFNAGSHTEIMQLSYADFARLVKPVEILM